MRTTWIYAVLLAPGVVLGHGEMAGDQPDVLVGAALGLVAHDNGAGDENGYWRVPGVLMGGEALPAEQGAAVDEAMLWGHYRINDRSFAHAGLAYHGDGVELENLFLSYHGVAGQPVHMRLGLTGASFSPSSMHHRAAGTFMESSLLADTFWGRDFHDVGLHADWKPDANWEFGVEIWDGQAFPGSKGKGTQDVYAKWQGSVSDWKLSAGAWAMRAAAGQRGDSRYNGDGHSPGGVVAAAEPVDVRFSGDSELYGAWFGIAAPPIRNVVFGLNYEALRARAGGQLSDETRVADYSADHLGYVISPYARLGKFSLAYRAEKLSLDNHISGAAAQILAEEANLITAAQPERQTVQLEWEAARNIWLQLAYTRDETLAESDNRVSAGLLWRDELYRR